jgi:hypothetical protein
MLLCSGLTAGWAFSSWVEASEGVLRPDLVVLADPDGSMEPGVRSTLSLARLLYRYDGVMGDLSLADTESIDVARMAGRSAKVVFIDAPLAFFSVTFGHEVFGHGARAREQGLTSSYRFHLVQPYSSLFGQHDEFAGEAYWGHPNQVDRDIALVTGGIEADYRMAYWIVHDLMRYGGASYGDLLMYMAARASYASSFFQPQKATDERDDVHQYVGLLQTRFNRWTDTERDSIASRLSTAYGWNWVDPMMIFAIHGLLVDHLGHGRRWSATPLPSVGSVHFLPWTSVNASPWGMEHQLDVFMQRDGVVVDVYGRVGSSRLAASAGGGVRVSGAKPASFLGWSAHVDGWYQPETLLSERNVFERPSTIGGNIGTETDFSLGSSVGLVLSAAYKTRGYLPARPLERGLYGYAGLRWTLP